jgi:putative DNA primase/helicase
MAKPPKRDDRWQRQLLLSEKGSLKPCFTNAVTILQGDLRWRGVLAFNDLIEAPVCLKPPRWHALDAPKKVEAGTWTDEDTLCLASWLARTYGLLLSPASVDDAVRVVAHTKRFHPVVDWLHGLKWDRKKRLDTWLVRHAHAEDTEYVRRLSAMWMISAVARAIEPGCKVDHVIVFEGPQGVGKSSMIAALCEDPAWFLETSTEIGKLDSYQVLLGKWIVEFAELDAFSRTEMSRVKAYLSTKVDTFRQSYGRRTKNFPRRVVFAGTTNAQDWLKDEEGRRFWPVWLPQRVDVKAIARERAQLFAEAYARYKKGEQWHLEEKKAIAVFAKEQDGRRQTHPWEQLVAKWLAKDVKLALRGVTTADALDQLGIEPSRRTPGEEQAIGRVLRALRWGRRRIRDKSSQVLEYRYFPLDGQEDEKPGNWEDPGTRTEAKTAVVLKFPGKRGSAVHAGEDGE